MRVCEQPLNEWIPGGLPDRLSGLLAASRHYPEDCGAPVFFDIETTGLSPLSASVYLIGATAPTEQGWVFRQWFAERPSEEADIISAFRDSIPSDAVLIHYNGSTFDIPFLRDRCRALSLGEFSVAHSLDFYPLLRVLKPLAGLPSSRQRDLEPLASYRREDPYDGGTLIRFYADFVGLQKFDTENAEARYRDLARHNREDILGLVTLTRLLPCVDISPTSVEHAELAQGDPGSVTLRLRMDADWPAGLTLRKPLEKFLTPKNTPMVSSLKLSSETDGGLLLTIPVLTEPARHYYANYKDYYYLPLENRVIHKSIASHMDKAYRRAAKRDEAFEWSRGTLLPQVGDLFSPVFVYRNKDLCRLFPVQELERHPELLATYAAELLQLFGRKC
ncbi:MAG: ribonuclease H-like domain-containing protein [Lachnospiraceae bacterium]|nr:ribonuclease H-like domain-containing protein [Lachnospiraceae bacterium]